MRLSTAIRLGDVLRPQCHGRLYVNDVSGNVYATCSLGAALEAIGELHSRSDYKSEIVRAFPVLGELHDTQEGTFRVLNTIIGMNDALRMTRLEIADWVESVEKDLGYDSDDSTASCIEYTDALQPVSR